MLPLLLGMGAAFIIGAGVQSKVPPAEKDPKLVEFQFLRQIVWVMSRGQRSHDGHGAAPIPSSSI